MMKTFDEMNGYVNRDEIARLKKFLADTDYCVSKIAEAEAYGEDTTALKQKYAETIRQRKEARARIDELENK